MYWSVAAQSVTDTERDPAVIRPRGAAQSDATEDDGMILDNAS